MATLTDVAHLTERLGLKLEIQAPGDVGRIYSIHNARGFKIHRCNGPTGAIAFLRGYEAGHTDGMAYQAALAPIIDDACEAEEVFGVDECERHAAELRAQGQL